MHKLTLLLATLAAAGTVSAQQFGTGCGAAPNASFYQTFASLSTFDLNGTSIRMTPNWFGGYDVTPGSHVYVPPLSADLGLSDDQISGPLALPAPFFFPGGFTNAVYMSSNGFLHLEAGGTQGCCAGTATSLLSGPARIAPFWADLNPTSTATNGSTHFEIVGSCALITWVDVPEFGQTVGNTFQICLEPTGVVEIIYESMNDPATHTMLAGFSPGNGAGDPGEFDLSVAVPAMFSTSPDRPALVLDVPGTCPPYAGRSVDFVTSNIPSGALASATILSFLNLNPGLPLPGAPGCEQYLDLGFVSAHIVMGSPTASLTLDLPPGGFNGISVFGQTACLVPGFNPFGVITSNGAEVVINAMPPVQMTEDFEGTTNGVGNYPLGWSDGGGTAMWSADSSGTPSAGTGPSAAFSGTQYMYCETSSPNTSATFIMNSDIYPAAGLSLLEFQLSRVGGAIGTLEVRLGDGTGTFPTVIGTFTGPNTAGDWVNELLCFSTASVDVQFQFHYTASGNYTGDLAIDDVILR